VATLESNAQLQAASAHKAHNHAPENSTATTDSESTCDENGHAKKTSRHARMNGRPKPNGQLPKSRNTLAKPSAEGKQAAVGVRTSPDAAGAVVGPR